MPRKKPDQTVEIGNPIMELFGADAEGAAESVVPIAVPPGEQNPANTKKPKSALAPKPLKTPKVLVRTKSTKTPARPLTKPLAPTLPGESAVNLALVDQAVHKINNIHQNGALATATAIGQFLLKTFFGNGLANFKAKQKKHQSFRACK